MIWVESVSPSFRARHDIRDADDANRLLYELERARARLERTFPRLPGDITVVLHGSPLGLTFTNPLLPLAWALTEPASRRYVAGWVSVALELRWAWLIEGGARWFAGQTDHARPAIARRLRDGTHRSFGQLERAWRNHVYALAAS